ncbi:MAG: hypothetical protein ACRC1M_05475 [Methanobacteriaceae archaeon]
MIKGFFVAAALHPGGLSQNNFDRGLYSILSRPFHFLIKLFSKKFGDEATPRQCNNYYGVGSLFVLFDGNLCIDINTITTINSTYNSTRSNTIKTINS